ncbi:MAG: PadR family transcriptional regulator [Actinobacteria bacterium]|nr:PadR family transcriptional regulator [Actinomycetota bacterium]
MARQSQTATAVLGVLSIEPATGYEIRQAMGSVLGHFWHESFGQIYPCLADLEADGLVQGSPGERANSRRYEITAAGRAHLAGLLAESPARQPPRNGTLLRVFFGQAQPPAALAALLDATETQARNRLATFAAIRADLATEEEHVEHVPYWTATIRAGELAAEAQLTWAAETRAALAPPATLPEP